MWLPEDDPRIETCWSDFKCFDVKFYVSALVGVIIKVILRKFIAVMIRTLISR